MVGFGLSWCCPFVLGCHGVVCLVGCLVNFELLLWYCLFGLLGCFWIVMILSIWSILDCHDVVYLVRLGDFRLSRHSIYILNIII